MKNKLRAEAKNLRKLIHSQEKDLKIIKNLRNSYEYKKSENILIYYPIEYEINTLPCLNDTDKIFYLPRVYGSELEICKFQKGMLKEGSFNIKEPCNEKIEDLSIIDNVIIPATAIDIKGYRLGYGKGFYDNFLRDKKVIKTVLIYNELIYHDIFHEQHDIKCDIAISENFILKF